MQISEQRKEEKREVSNKVMKMEKILYEKKREEDNDSLVKEVINFASSST